jgi:sporulation protein YunB
MSLIRVYSRNQAQWYATKIINEAVTEVLSAENTNYETLVAVSRNGDGAVQAVEVDVATVNRLKAAVSLAVTEQVGERKNVQVDIPLFTFLGSHWLTGRGPFVHIPVSMNGSVLTTVTSTFTEAGINQTSHRIEMQIKTNMEIAIPTGHTSVSVETPFIIAESILLGKVPDAFTNVEGDTQDTTGQIFDYRSEMQN